MRVERHSNSAKCPDEKLDIVIKRLDVIAVTLLASSGLKGKDIAHVLDMSRPSVTRILPLRKIKAKPQETKV